MFHDFVDQRVVVLSERYIYRGLLVEERGVFLKLTGCHQVTDHDAERIKEEIKIGDLLLHADRIEACYLEAGTSWLPSGRS